VQNETNVDSGVDNSDKVDGQDQANDNDQNESEGKNRAEVRQERDFFKWKKESRELKEQNEKLLNEINTLKEKSLVEKQNYKELYEHEKQKTERLVSENEDVKKTFFGSLKQQEIQKEAIKQGIRDEAIQDLNLLDSSLVETETTSQGVVNILGATEFIEKIKESRPYWFKQSGPPTINTGNVNYQKKELTASDLLKLEKDNPALYRAELLKRLQQKPR